MRPAVLAAMSTAAAMIAYQVGGRAIRDALFFNHFPVSSLPAMTIASALFAIGLALFASRRLAVTAPERVIPAGFAVSALLLLVEWALVAPAPRLAAVLVFLHYGGLGAVLISGFWSLVSERFDPRSAKREVGRIAAAGTVGGLLGGLVAERVGVHAPIAVMLPILAGFHLLCAAGTSRLGPPLAGQPDRSEGTGEPLADDRSGVRAICRSEYLRNVAYLVVLITVSEVLLDFIFKARATGAMAPGGEQLRLFAAFYTAAALLTFALQAVLSRVALQRLGLAGTIAVRPAVTAAGALGALAMPGLASITVARGLESVTANSLYRAGYEFLFTPVAAREKRSAKSLLDVGAVRVGDIVGAALVQFALFAVAGGAGLMTGLLAGSAVLALAAGLMAARLHRGYVDALEDSLKGRAEALDLSGIFDPLTKSAIIRTLDTMVVSRASLGIDARHPETATEIHPAPSPETARARELTSRDPGRVRRALKAGPLPEELIPRAIQLLAWNDVARDSVEALRASGPAALDPLLARLGDPNTDFAIRRRIPLVLAVVPDARALAGLLNALRDPRFEVRFRCARALVHLGDLDPTLRISRESAIEAVMREIESEKGVWRGRQILDQMDDDAWSPVVDETIRTRADRSLEHVFTLLALTLPREPLKIAFRGLHTTDPLLRGTALEYLETALPPDIRRGLWPYLEVPRPGRTTKRPPEEVLADLLGSKDSIAINLDSLRRTPPPQ